MKNFKPLLFLFAISFFACSEDEIIVDPPEEVVIPCSDELFALDTILLSPETNEFLAYDGTEGIIFKNSEDKEIRFDPLSGSLRHVFREDDFELVCEDGSFNNYAFVREQYVVSHKCEDLNLQYYLNIYTVNSGEIPEFVDYFNLIFHEPALDNVIDTSISLGIITSFKGNEDLLSEEFSSSNDGYEILDKVELLDKSFNDVYRVIEPEENQLTELYYNKEFGIVGFKDLESELWVFDRFE